MGMYMYACMITICEFLRS